jgi:hypothetical protein
MSEKNPICSSRKSLVSSFFPSPQTRSSALLLTDNERVSQKPAAHRCIDSSLHYLATDSLGARGTWLWLTIAIASVYRTFSVRGASSLIERECRECNWSFSALRFLRREPAAAKEEERERSVCNYFITALGGHSRVRTLHSGVFQMRLKAHHVRRAVNVTLQWHSD